MNEESKKFRSKYFYVPRRTTYEPIRKKSSMEDIKMKDYNNTKKMESDEKLKNIGKEPGE